MYLFMCVCACVCKCMCSESEVVREGEEMEDYYLVYCIYILSILSPQPPPPPPGSSLFCYCMTLLPVFKIPVLLSCDTLDSVEQHANLRADAIEISSQTDLNRLLHINSWCVTASVIFSDYFKSL